MHLLQYYKAMDLMWYLRGTLFCAGSTHGRRLLARRGQTYQTWQRYV